MARESVLALNKSIQAKDFTFFYNHTAKLWQKQTSPKALQAEFQEFIDNDVDLSGVAKADAKFDQPPTIDSDDLLNMNGVFVTDDYDVKFELQYAIEKRAWKLVSINVNAVPN